jgi:L-arabinose transport system permease protein
MVVAIAMQATGSASLGIAAALAGLVDGLIVTYGRVNAVITTLGTMAAFRGCAFLTSGGSSASIVNEDFRFLGSGVVLSLPVPILILLVVLVVFAVFLNATVVGRNIYAIGGNPTVARFAGIPIRRYQIGIYVLSGAAAGLVGLLLASRTMSGQPASGSQGLELEAITAAILGGCALQGGKGRSWARS